MGCRGYAGSARSLRRASGGLPDGIQELNGIGFVHQTSAGERKSTAFQNNFLQLVELIENGEPDVVHLSLRGKPN